MRTSFSHSFKLLNKYFLLTQLKKIQPLESQTVQKMSLCVRKGINAFQWAGNVTIHRTVPIIPMKKIVVSKSFISKSREGTANRKFNALWRCEWVWGKSNLRLSYIYIIIFRRFVYHRLKLCKFHSYTHTNSLSFSDERSVFFFFVLVSMV